MITANHSPYTISYKLNRYDDGSTYSSTMQQPRIQHITLTITKTLENFNNPKI